MRTLNPGPTRGELGVALLLLAMVGAWLLLPAIQQPAHYHDFADRRSFLGIANAADVLSNAAFAAVGLYGLWQLRQGRRILGGSVHVSLYAFFAGLVLTALGSAYYHLQPTNTTLALDRLPMTVAFAGAFGGVVAERISGRSGAVAFAFMLLAGPVSVFYWMYTDDLSMYAVVQFGGMAGMLIVLVATARGAEALPWWSLIVWYALAKLAELGDAAIWEASSAIVAGHPLKHFAAAAGGFVIARALRGPASGRRPSDTAADVSRAE